jgi:hypothetical protein
VQEPSSGGRSPRKLAVCFFVSLLLQTSVVVSNSSTPTNNVVKMLESFILLSSVLLGDIGRKYDTC